MLPHQLVGRVDHEEVFIDFVHYLLHLRLVGQVHTDGEDPGHTPKLLRRVSHRSCALSIRDEDGEVLRDLSFSLSAKAFRRRNIQAVVCLGRQADVPQIVPDTVDQILVSVVLVQWNRQFANVAIRDEANLSLCVEAANVEIVDNAGQVPAQVVPLFSADAQAGVDDETDVQRSAACVG